MVWSWRQQYAARPGPSFYDLAMPLVAGVDSSTGSTKVEVRDLASGTLIASGSGAHPVTTPPRSEQHPDRWWAAFEGAWAGAGSPEVAAISVAGQQHGMVVLDDGGAVLRPAKLWNDTESAPNADSLVKAGGGPGAWAERCGSVPVAAFTVTKLAWLAQHEPETFAAVAHVMLPHDWLTYRLTGRFCTDRGDASGTGYWSPASGHYRTDLLDLIDPARPWASMLPEVLQPLEQAGTWRGAIVAPGTGDNMAAALGCGLQPGDVAISLGTSGTVYSVAEHPTADPTGAVAGFADATGRFLPLVCTLNATKVTEAIRRLLGVDHAAFDALALASPMGASGLTLLPYLDGERTPNRPDARGVLGGLRSDVTPGDLARAAVEGVICGLLDGVDALGRFAPVSNGRLVLVGGGARSAAYRQILADLSGRVVWVPLAEEHVAAGACVQAAAVLLGEDPSAVAARWNLGNGTEVAPLRTASAAAADLRSRYDERRDLEAPPAR
jgi:xylulokinase